MTKKVKVEQVSITIKTSKGSMRKCYKKGCGDIWELMELVGRKLWENSNA